MIMDIQFTGQRKGGTELLTGDLNHILRANLYLPAKWRLSRKFARLV